MNQTNYHTTGANLSGIDNAINEARNNIPEAFDYERIPEIIMERGRIIIGEGQTVPVKNIDDVIDSMDEEETDYPDAWKDKDDEWPENWHIEWCAFFRSFHFTRNWGIFIKKNCLASLANKLRYSVGGTTFKECLEFVFFTILYHEKYHYKIAMLALLAEINMKRAVYIPYWRNVYDPTFLTNGNYEEGLANAFAFSAMSRAPINKNNFPEKKAWLENWLDRSPPGYNQYKNYSGGNFRPAQGTLISCLLDARIHSVNTYGPLQDFLINSGHKFWSLEKDGKVYLCD